MTDCRKCRDMMIEALYNELGPGEKLNFDGHLSSCPECASQYSVLGATLKVMDERRRPDPGPAFWDGYWDRLVRRMENEPLRPVERIPLRMRLARALAALPRWSYQAAAAAALVAVGVLLGRSLLSPPARVSPAGTGTVSPLVEPAANRDTARAQDYLERSKLLLLALVNYDPATEDAVGLDLPRQKTISRELISQAADIKSSLKDPGQDRLRSLIADLEVILLQIANLESENDLEAVDLVKQGVEQKGIFLKINLDQMARSVRSEPRPARPLGASGPRDKSKV